MRLSDLYKYLAERFPDMKPEISSRIEGGTEKVFIDFKLTLTVNFDLDEVDDGTIFQDVANMARSGLVQLFNKSQEADKVEETVVEPLENILTADPIAPSTELVETDVDMNGKHF